MIKVWKMYPGGPTWPLGRPIITTDPYQPVEEEFMPTPIPSNPWMEHAAAQPMQRSMPPAQQPVLPAQQPVPDQREIKTVGDYIDAHDLHVIIAIDGFLDLPIGDVTVDHDSLAQLTYFNRDGSPIGTASWGTA